MGIPEEFYTYLRYEQRRSGFTVDGYRLDLSQFVSWLCPNGEEFDSATVTLNDLRAWLLYMAGTCKVSSLRRKGVSLRTYFKWAHKVGLVKSNPAQNLQLPKPEKPLPEFVKESEMEIVLDKGEKAKTEAVKKYSSRVPQELFIATRNHVIINILYTTGIRQAELLSLTDADVNKASLEIRVTGKRQKTRVIPIPAQLMEEIEVWQKLRDQRYYGLPTPKPLIATVGGAMSKVTLYLIVNKALKGTGCSKCSPHVLRHSFATAMMNDGADLDVVKEMLGHSSLATTEIYTHLTFDQLRHNYRSHPRSQENITDSNNV